MCVCASGWAGWYGGGRINYQVLNSSILLLHLCLASEVIFVGPSAHRHHHYHTTPTITFCAATAAAATTEDPISQNIRTGHYESNYKSLLMRARRTKTYRCRVQIHGGYPAAIQRNGRGKLAVYALDSLVFGCQYSS